MMGLRGISENTNVFLSTDPTFPSFSNHPDLLSTDPYTPRWLQLLIGRMSKRTWKIKEGLTCVSGHISMLMRTVPAHPEIY